MALTREQIGSIIIAAGEEARRALADEAWMRRRRHGDPTAFDELGERACLRLALPPRELVEAFKADPKLAAAYRASVEAALADAEQASAPARRLRRVLVFGIPTAVVVCVVAFVVYQMYQNDPEVRRRAAARAAAAAAGQPAP